MSFFNEYPYRNLTDLNLDWLINAIRTLRHDVDDFVTMNAIKYADPIDWSITTQYEKNTVVIDANTGVAYLSVAAVPAGVNITRPEYWTVIFDLSRFLNAGVSNLANSYEANLTYTATVPTDEGNWVLWNGTLYEALNDIHIGDRYVPDSNIKKTTVEDFVARVITAINTEVQNRIDADGVLQDHINDEAQARQDADTTLQGHIDDEAQARQDADTTLQGHIDDEVQARQDADTTLQGHIDDEVQARQNADTSLREYIDEQIQEMKSPIYYNVQDYGAKGDGVTDDTQAFNAAITAAHQTNGVVFVPDVADFYLITSALVLGSKSYILGEKEAKIHFTSENLFSISDYYGSIENLVIQGNNTNNAVFFDLDTAVVYIWRFNHLHIKNCVHAFYDNVSGNNYIVDCIFNDINCDYTYGTQFLSHRSRGFITLRNFKADNTNNLRDISWDSIVITDVIGVEMEAVDVVGPVTRGNYTVDTYQNVWGIKITGTTDGKASIWLSRVLVDTTPINGILISNVNYINGNYVEAFGIVGTGILLTNCEEGNISNIMCRGGSGISYAPAGANGIQLQNCKKFNLANVISQYNTGTGVSIYADEKVHITNAVSENNGAYGYLELDGNGGNVLVGGSLVGNVTNVSQNNANSAISNVLVGTSLEVSRVGTYSA